MLPKELWEKLPRLEQKKFLWWLRLRWVKYQLHRHFRMHTPAPICFAIRTTLIAFATLFLLPQHPISMISAMVLGLIVALVTHTPDLHAPKPGRNPVPIRRIRYTVVPLKNGAIELRGPKKYVVHRDGRVERVDRSG